MKFQLHESAALNTTKMVILFMVVAYLFSVGMRMIWIYDAQGVSTFFWNNALMINTNDGYYFAEGARDLLAGNHQPNDLSPITDPLAMITAWLAKILPVSFETLLVYMPSVFGSLIVIPLVLMGRAFNQTAMGFIAALLAGIANSYYNRTMSGYYDTDMLTIVLPLFSLYFLMVAMTRQRNHFLLPITLMVALNGWWYPQSYSLNTAILVMLLVYTVVFERKNYYFYKIILFILLGLLSLPLTVKLALALALFAFLPFQPSVDKKWFWIVFGAGFALYFGTGGIDPIWNELKSYLFREAVSNEAGLHFYNVAQTVREAGHIPFTVFVERISGSTVVFVLACVGYLLALLAYRPLILTLPLVGLGFIAMSAGLRFTIYAVAPMALGFGYLLFYITQAVEKKWLQIVTVVVFTGAALYPNYQHIKGYQNPTVLINKEVRALDQLKQMASREDYVVSWWDYGYPIRYYSDVKTLVDGGKHSGDVNYPASYILTQPQENSALMSRLSVEYTEKGFETNQTQIIAQMFKDYKVTNTDDLITTIESNPSLLPKATRSIYLYLPLRMMEILPTVTLFSQLDLQHPQDQPQQPLFYASQVVDDTGKTLELDGGVVSIIKAKNSLTIGGREIPIKGFYQVGYDNSMKLQIQEQHFASEGLNVIYLSSYGKFLILDDFYLHSTYIQLFVFEHYNPKLFEPVVLDPLTKIYKLKV